jgi:feruloyl esterase
LLTGFPAGGGALIPLFGTDFVRYMAFEPDPGPSYSILNFNFDTDPPRMNMMSEIYNSTNPDLSKFKARGGKLLMYQGWADAIVTEPLIEIARTFGVSHSTISRLAEA